MAGTQVTHHDMLFAGRVHAWCWHFRHGRGKDSRVAAHTNGTFIGVEGSREPSNAKSPWWRSRRSTSPASRGHAHEAADSGLCGAHCLGCAAAKAVLGLHFINKTIQISLNHATSSVKPPKAVSKD